MARIVDKYPHGEKPLLRAQIEDAILHTNSASAAARYLGVSYRRFRRWAIFYGLFEKIKNQNGVGISKGFGKRPTTISLSQVLAGKHPRYNRLRLRNRLIKRNLLPPECSLCHFSEKRFTDGKMPLILDHIDGDPRNFALANLRLLCYNCAFLTRTMREIPSMYRITSTLTREDSKARQAPVLEYWNDADYVPPEDHPAHLSHTDHQISELEKLRWLEELDDEDDEDDGDWV